MRIENGSLSELSSWRGNGFTVKRWQQRCDLNTYIIRKNESSATRHVMRERNMAHFSSKKGARSDILKLLSHLFNRLPTTFIFAKPKGLFVSGPSSRQSIVDDGRRHSIYEHRRRGARDDEIIEEEPRRYTIEFSGRRRPTIDRLHHTHKKSSRAIK